MTKSELAAQKCTDLMRNLFGNSYVGVPDYFKGNNPFRLYVEHVSDLCEHAIASGDTSGLEELVLREAVDPDMPNTDQEAEQRGEG